MPLTRFEVELYKAASLTQLGALNSVWVFKKKCLQNRNFAEWRLFHTANIVKYFV